MEKLTKRDPEFYSKISQMRKVKSGGKTFLDKKKAQEANKLSVASRLRNSAERAKNKED